MKVLYLLRYYPTLTESFIYEEIRSLIRYQEADIEIFALSKRSDGIHQTRTPNVPVQYIPKARWRRFQKNTTLGMDWLSKHQRKKDVCKLPKNVSEYVRYFQVHNHPEAEGGACRSDFFF